MTNYSTRAAAKKLGISHATLANYIKIGKVSAPKSIASGGGTIHIWTEDEIGNVRKLLPKIKNGRKTRYKKQTAQTKKKKQ